jgi:hypothetical protein
MIFISELKYTGKHAEIIRKFSKAKNTSEETSKLTFNSYDGLAIKNQELILFDTYFNGLVISALIGLKKNHKVKMDSNSSIIPASIFTDILFKNASLLTRIFQFINLIENKPNNDEKIKKAFNYDYSSSEVNFFMEEILQYSCAGLEFINDQLIKVNTLEDVILAINKILND